MGGSLKPVFEIKSFAYDYYYFMKRNYIILDYYNNPRRLFKIYIKAMLCSYIEFLENNNEVILYEPELYKYNLNKIDIDIITKFISSKDLNTIINEYKLKTNIIFDETVEDSYLINCFVNLCESIIKNYNRNFVEYIKTYLVLFKLVEINETNLKEIIDSLCRLIDKYNSIFEEIIDELIEFLKTKNDLSYVNFDNFIQIVLNVLKIQMQEHISINEYKFRKLFYIINKNYCYNKIDISKESYDLINGKVENKDYYLYAITPLLIDKEKINIKLNIEDVGSDYLIQFMQDSFIECDELTLLKIVNKIYEETKLRLSTNVITYPCSIEHNLERVLLLHLLYDIDVNIFAELVKSNGYIKFIDLKKRYRSYIMENHIYLEFIEMKEKFDFSQIKELDYMWLNFMNIDKYRKIILENAKDIIKAKFIEGLEKNIFKEKEIEKMIDFLSQENSE